MADSAYHASLLARFAPKKGAVKEEKLSAKEQAIRAKKQAREDKKNGKKVRRWRRQEWPPNPIGSWTHEGKAYESR